MPASRGQRLTARHEWRTYAESHRAQSGSRSGRSTLWHTGGHVHC
jgi:hypothetical protein